MRVLMLGWEFPPFKAGGLGEACHALAKGLSHNGVEITFVMPHAPDGATSPFAKLRSTDEIKNVRIRKVETILTPYMTSSAYDSTYERLRTKTGASAVYGKNMHEEVERYTAAITEIAQEEPHDIIHAHDWMTFKAAIRAKKKTKKPMVVHVHATEYDRTGGNPNEYIRKIEEEGLHHADHVITISDYMKKQIIKNYNIAASKISVVHWGIDHDAYPAPKQQFRSALSKQEKIVLFLGRITIQKGPDYFVEAARHVLRFVPNARFVMAGDGDMMGRMINRVAELGMANRFSFTGFLKGTDVHKAYQMADVYVMPSVSEPFGLVGLEALKNRVPIIISKTSGVSEVVTNALRVDFWDVEEMANKIVGVLRYPQMQAEMQHNGFCEVMRLNVDAPAQKVMKIYNNVGVGG